MLSFVFRLARTTGEGNGVVFVPPCPVPFVPFAFGTPFVALGPVVF
jgi:hypothetical protein